MEGSRLAVLFSNLDKKERSEVTRAVHTPYFNVREDVAALWQLLCKQQALPTKEAVFAAIYPNLPYDAQKVRALMSWLLDLVERVLAIRAFEQAAIPPKLYLLRAFRQKGLTQHFREIAKEIGEKQRDIGQQDSAFYQQSYEMEWLNYELSSINRATELNLQVISDTLDIGFMVEKLRQSCFLLAHQAVFKKDYDTGLLSLLLSHIAAKEELLAIPAIRTYYYCYFALKEPTQTAHFEVFSAAILEFHSLFSESDIRDLYLAAVNYCIKKHNGGEQDYARRGLELYKKGLSEGFLLENNTLSRFAFHNIVAWALLFEEYEWAEGFIAEYRNRLERTYRDSMFSFCSAKLEYSRRNYEAAMLLLQRAEYRDTLLALAAKTILMKIYYELDEFDALDAHLSSMRAYLKRKRVLGYHKTNYQNIINYTQKLTTIFNNSQKISALREAIFAEAILTEKEWLLAQL